MPSNTSSYSKQYYQKNRAKILERAAQKNTCEICEGSYTNGSKSKHVSSNKHQTAIRLKSRYNDSE